MDNGVITQFLKIFLMSVVNLFIHFLSFKNIYHSTLPLMQHSQIHIIILGTNISYWSVSVPTYLKELKIMIIISVYCQFRSGEYVRYILPKITTNNNLRKRTETVHVVIRINAQLLKSKVITKITAIFSNQVLV